MNLVPCEKFSLCGSPLYRLIAWDVLLKLTVLNGDYKGGVLYVLWSLFRTVSIRGNILIAVAW